MAGGTNSFSTVWASRDGTIVADGGYDFSGIGERSGGTVIGCAMVKLNCASKCAFRNIAFVGPTVIPTGAANDLRGRTARGHSHRKRHRLVGRDIQTARSYTVWGNITGRNSGGRVVLNGPTGRPDTAVVAGVQGLALGRNCAHRQRRSAVRHLQPRRHRMHGEGNVINIAVTASTYNEGEIVAGSGGHVSLTGSHLYQTTTGRIRADGSRSS